MVRRSITSASMPSSLAIFSAAISDNRSIRPNDTIVTSLPSRATRETPNGTVKSGSSGTSPFIPYSAALSRKITGSRPRMAVFNIPFASAGVAGTATLRPGKCP